ncbi:MAG TPA: cytochrome C [Thalassospira sp.]|nr:cytochrome C [Thalassospira sp.]HCK17023.1 cytochrome C [Thalassospira sp.]|tara:strand:+ start:1667 stop:2125 length:459 start_codon:yes stop_codon:yes gene_type:complete
MRELKILIGTAVALSMVGSIAAIAHEGATGVVKERMEGMKAIGQQVKIMVPMMKGALPYDPDQVAKAATIIEGHSGETFTALFPEGSNDKPSEALSDIWEDWSKFTDLANELNAKAGDLKTVAVSGGSEDDFKATLGSMMQTCKSCHSDFKE